ncbi:hypothetical protein [Ferrovum sp.]|uniref:hypothetical protein n=1 Tax=Ferrovum sp. TaxID=2609467 RepID=UPI002636E71C|nr:hypothetical protein [Ferrovum sp.]
MTRKSLKNSKHLVDLIESATVPSIAQLSQVDKFVFLAAVDASLPPAQARLALIEVLATVSPEAIAVADQESIRFMQLVRFQSDALLEHAYDTLEFEEHPDLSSFDQKADVMTRLVWLRAMAPKIFDQIETIYLTHHFHGHKKFLGFTVREGDGRDFVWSEDVEQKLHAAVGEILTLDDEAKAGCELIHFEMEEGDDAGKRRLHYLVVYHPGKMRLLHQMKDRQRDLLHFIPALEATLVYDPANNMVHVLSDRASVARQLADRFSQIGFDKPLSRQPVDAMNFELSMFKTRVDLTAAHAPGAFIEDAWISSLTVTLGHTYHSVTLDMTSSDNIWNVSAHHFGDHNPITFCRSVQEVKLSFIVRFDGETELRALDITVGQRGSCNLLTLPDPRLRQCGEDILMSLGVMTRVELAKIGADLALFHSEMKLLDLALDEIDGHLLTMLQLSIANLISKGLLKKKAPGKFIVVPVKDDEGQSGFRRLPIQSNSTSTWAQDELSGDRYDLTDGDLCRYTVDKSYLRERLDTLLKKQLIDHACIQDDQEPFIIGNYRMGDQHLPVALVSHLWDARHADKMDAAMRQENLGLSIVLTTTTNTSRRFLGQGIVVPLNSIQVEGDDGVALDLSRIEGEVRRRQNAAVATEVPILIKDDARNALLVGPWSDPWALTKKEWINVVEILVDAWTSHREKCSKLQLENAAEVPMRSMGEFFRGAPEWKNYIRGADGNSKPRLWELNIGVPDYKTT